LPHIEPGWRSVLALAAALTVAAVLARRTRVAVALREAVVVCLLYDGWIGIGTITRPHVDGALARGRSLFNFEQDLHLPSEVSVQQLVLPHPWLVHVVDAYYAYGHLNVIGVTLFWCWLRHREAYPAMRLQLIVLTVVGEAIQVYAVAPPRLLPDLGFVDLALRYGESVYGNYGSGITSQLLAMPSLHVGWAALVAWTVWRQAHGSWRWIGVTHLVLMTLAVVATANHWWLDGFVAMGLLAGIVAAPEAMKRVRYASAGLGFPA
jgi:hypothetical protein